MILINVEDDNDDDHNILADPEGASPLSVQFLLFSCSFPQTFCQMIGWCTPSGKFWIPTVVMFFFSHGGFNQCSCLFLFCCADKSSQKTTRVVLLLFTFHKLMYIKSC